MKTQEIAVVKIGGNVIEDPAALEGFLDAFSKMEGPKILVHGGGKLATSLANKLGIPSTLIQGRRITDAQNLEVITMVYAGLANKNIVAQLQAKKCNAIGLSGVDANTILAHKRPVKEVDYGFVGDIDQANPDAISCFIQGGFTPVFCAITHDGKGQLLNTNADTIAAEIAIALSVTYDTCLFYCFEKNGVLKDINDPNSVIPDINTASYQELLDKKYIADGMLPKMQNCFHALQRNVSKVCIGNTDMLDPKTNLYTTIRL